jgi:hypothetical protein
MRHQPPASALVSKKQTLLLFCEIGILHHSVTQKTFAPSSNLSAPRKSKEQSPNTQNLYLQANFFMSAFGSLN